MSQRSFAKGQGFDKHNSPLVDPQMTEALKRQNQQQVPQSRMQKMFGRKKKVSEEMPLLDIKGNRINYGSNPEVSQGNIEK